jgi:hypothetical protein
MFVISLLHRRWLWPVVGFRYRAFRFVGGGFAAPYYVSGHC